MESHKEKILVVDDEASIRRILETRLSMIGYDVVTAADGEEALDTFRNAEPDLVVLDVMMPKLDGYGVCQELRKESDVPIIMLTALGDVADRITGLELGADDYVVKPFSPKELEARIRSVLRRVDKTGVTGIPSSGIIHINSIRIDTNKRQVYKGDERIRLTGMEFSLLELLVSKSGDPVFSIGDSTRSLGLHSRTPCRYSRRGCSHFSTPRQARRRSQQSRANPDGTRNRLSVPAHFRTGRNRIAECRRENLQFPADSFIEIEPLEQIAVDLITLVSAGRSLSNRSVKSRLCLGCWDSNSSTKILIDCV